MDEKKVNRRQFLRTAALAATGGVVAACATPTPETIVKEVTKEVEVEKVVTNVVSRRSRRPSSSRARPRSLKKR